MFDLVPFRRGKPAERSEERSDTFGTLTSNLMDDFFNLTRSGFSTDIKEKEEEFVIEAELPGLSKDDITLEVEDDTLIISVQEEEEFEDEREDYIHRERRTGSYQRSFRLDNIDEEKIAAEYENGILEITLPKEEPGKGRRRTIDIN